MNHSKIKSVFLLLVICFAGGFANAQNTYVYSNGTNWYAGFYDIIEATDPSAFKSVSYTKEENAKMWDREANNNKGAWITPKSWVYKLSYDDGISAEIRIRQLGFNKSQADSLADRYGKKIGQLPACLRKGVADINILKSDALFGGNNFMKSIDITIGQTSALYDQTGNMEETIFHEATHAALDYLYQQNWSQFRDKDPKYISKYAADNPNREDISESFILYAALNYRIVRVASESVKITTNIPNRLLYYQQLGLDMYPFATKSVNPTPLFDSNAYYRLTTEWQGEGKSLDIVNDGQNNQLILAKTGNYTGQMWKITKIGDDTYTLHTKWQGPDKTLEFLRKASRDVLQLKGGSDASGSLWKIIPIGNGYYRITHLWASNLSLDIVNDGTNNKVHMATTGSYTGQYWKITKIK